MLDAVTSRSDLRAAVWRDGVAVLRHAPSTDADLLELASDFGRPTSTQRNPALVRSISPTDTEDSPPNTLSSRFGLAQFPLHTDGAHWPTPPRFLMLRCDDAGSGSRPTLIVDGARLLVGELAPRLRRAVFKVQDVRIPFTCRIIERAGSADRLRFDGACMQPLATFAKVLHDLHEELDQLEPDSHAWEPDDLLVLDNWRMLHARGPATCVDKDRTLRRILVAERTA